MIKFWIFEWNVLLLRCEFNNKRCFELIEHFFTESNIIDYVNYGLTLIKQKNIQPFKQGI
mgnify:CR=1 FL=1